MEIMTNILLLMIIIPVLLFISEYFLSKNKSKIAIVLPVIIACFFVVVGFYALIISAIMFAIHFLMQYLEKEKQAKLSEIDKMNIEDL